MTLIIKYINETGPRGRVRSGQNRSVSSRFRLRVNTSKPDPVELESQLIAHPKFPTVWPSDPGCFLGDIALSQNESGRFHWDVDATWATIQANSDDDNPEDPLARPVKRSIRSNATTEFVIKDREGNIYANTIGDLYDPLEVPVLYPQIYRKFTTTSFSEASADWYERTMNTDPWNGYPAKTLRIADIQADQIIMPGNRLYPAGLTYWEIELILQYKKDTWTHSVVNSGFFKRWNIASTRKSRIMTPVTDYDDPDHPVVSWVPCEERTPLSEDGVFELNKPGDTLFLQQFEFFNEISYAWIPV